MSVLPGKLNLRYYDHEGKPCQLETSFECNGYINESKNSARNAFDLVLERLVESQAARLDPMKSASAGLKSLYSSWLDMKVNEPVLRSGSFNWQPKTSALQDALEEACRAEGLDFGKITGIIIQPLVLNSKKEYMFGVKPTVDRPLWSERNFPWSPALCHLYSRWKRMTQDVDFYRVRGSSGKEDMKHWAALLENLRVLLIECANEEGVGYSVKVEMDKVNNLCGKSYS